MHRKPRSPRAPEEHDGKHMSSMKEDHPEAFRPSMRGIGKRRGYSKATSADRYSCKQLRMMHERGIE